MGGFAGKEKKKGRKINKFRGEIIIPKIIIKKFKLLLIIAVFDMKSNKKFKVNYG